MCQRIFRSLNFISVALLTVISGCVYYPQATDIPLISEKKDLRVDAGVSSGVSAHGTVSYGLTDKVAVQVFGRYGNDVDEFYLQGSAGIFKKHLNEYITEFYGGYGYGETSYSKHDDQGYLSGNYKLYFLQWNIGQKDRRFANLDYGLSMKAGLLTTSMLDRGYWVTDYMYPEPGTLYHDKSLLLEPNAMIRIGGEKLKFTMKFGTCLLYKFTHTDYHLPYSKWSVGIGVNYHF